MTFDLIQLPYAPVPCGDRRPVIAVPPEVCFYMQQPLTASCTTAAFILRFPCVQCVSLLCMAVKVTWMVLFLSNPINCQFGKGKKKNFDWLWIDSTGFDMVLIEYQSRVFSGCTVCLWKCASQEGWFANPHFKGGESPFRGSNKFPFLFFLCRSDIGSVHIIPPLFVFSKRSTLRWLMELLLPPENPSSSQRCRAQMCHSGHWDQVFFWGFFFIYLRQSSEGIYSAPCSSKERLKGRAPWRQKLTFTPKQTLLCRNSVEVVFGCCVFSSLSLWHTREVFMCSSGATFASWGLTWQNSFNHRSYSLNPSQTPQASIHTDATN